MMVSAKYEPFMSRKTTDNDRGMSFNEFIKAKSKCGFVAALLWSAMSVLLRAIVI